MRQRKVVEQEQLSGLQIDRNFDLIHIEVMAGKKGNLVKQTAKLQAAEKPGSIFMLGRTGAA